MVTLKSIGKLFISISIVSLIGCAPPKFIPKDPPIIEFNKTPSYKVDLSNIVKPDKPIYTWTDENFKLVPMNEAKYLILTKDEFGKFVAQLKIKETYKELIYKQEDLMNVNIEIINSLKEYVKLEEMKSKEYRDLWVDAENAYRQEKYYNEINSFISKGFLGFISIGAIVALVLAL